MSERDQRTLAIIREAMLFGAALGSRAIRELVETEEFSLEEIRNAVTEIKRAEPDKQPVIRALREFGVVWDGEGKAIDAVRAAVAEHAMYQRAMLAARRELKIPILMGDKRTTIDLVRRALTPEIAERYGL